MIFNSFKSSELKHELEKASPNIPIYQEPKGGKHFNQWKVYKNHIMVIDRCHRLTYQVIVPWSILRHPYVKAAIASTYLADPCGGCVATAVTNSSSSNNNSSQETFSEESSIGKNKVEKVYLKMEETKTSEVTNSTTISTTTTTTTTTTTEAEKEETFPDIASSWGTTLTDHILLNEENNYGNFMSEENIIEEEETSSFVSSTSSLTSPVAQEATNLIESSLIETSKEINKSDDSLLTYQIQEIVEEQTFNGSKINEEDNSENDQIDSFKYVYVEDAEQPKSPAVDEIYNVELKKDNNVPYWPLKTNYKKKKRKHRKKTDDGFLNTPFPLKIILRNPHEHFDGQNRSQHDYSVLQYGDPAYHNHVDNDKDVYIERLPHSNATRENEEKPITDLTEDQKAEVVSVYLKKNPLPNAIQKSLLTDSHSHSFKTGSQESGESSSKEEAAQEEGQSSQTAEMESSSEEVAELVHHYSKLLPWISFPL